MQSNSSSLLKYIGALSLVFLLIFGIIRLRTLPPKIIEQSRILQKAERIEGGSSQYKKYTIHVPKGWAIAHSRTKEKIDTLSIMKDSYKIEIYQKNNAEQLSCDVIFIAETENVLGVTSKESYVEFKGQQGKEYRRSIIPPNPNAKLASNTICEKTEDGYNLPTQFGIIEYETPIDANEKMLQEMDTMIKSME